ncbi:hypothetical protein F5Y14DRAFT_466196 [Nemania sp. NC0429]|nr:hypothetical protein F5Y14DRAFT_466196 [Nemania sp. NC0429]
MAQEMYHLNGPNGPTQGPAGRYGGPPGGLPQGYQQGHSAAPAGLPRNMTPVDMRGGPTIQISDVTRDLLSESDMKEELSDFAVFRFEKMVDKDGFDDLGQPRRPSWEKVIRSEDRSISKQAAAQMVRRLNQSTKPVLDKKNSLMAPLKLQLDKTLELLMSQELDHTHFHWILVQLDHQLVPIVSYPYHESYDYSAPTKKRRSSSYRHSLSSPSSSKKKSRSKTGSHHKKRPYERVSLTAYFQRVPRPSVDIHGLWRDKKRGLGSFHRPQPVEMNNAFPPAQHPHNQFPTQQQQQQHHLHHQQPGGREQGPAPMRNPGPPPQGPHHPPGARPPGPPPGHHPPGPHPQGPHPAGRPLSGPNQPPVNRPVPHGPHQPNGGPGYRQNPNQGQGQGQRRERHSDPDSDSESDSRASRDTSSGLSGRTPPSSVSGGHPGGGARRHNSHLDDHHQHAHNPGNNRPYAHGPQQHKQPGAANHHRMNGIVPGQQQQQQPRASRSPHPHPHPHRPPHAPARPQPLSTEGGSSVATHIERVREEAFRRGRLAERKDALLAEDLAFPFPGAHTHGHGRALSPTTPRMYGSKEEAVRRYLAELSVYDDDDDDDADDDVEFRRGSAGDARRRREYESRVQRGSILQDDPFEASTTVPSSYAYSADGRAGAGVGVGVGLGGGRGPPVIGIPGRRPLSPRGPPRRIVSYY